MTGIKRKAARRAREKRVTPEGLLRDAKDWTVADWKSLFVHIEAAKKEIAERHNK